MVTREVEIINKTGLHARPASEFIQTCSKFKCKITIGRANDEDRYDAKSIMNILLLGLCHGERAVLTAEGEDEEEAITTLVNLFNSGFGE